MQVYAGLNLNKGEKGCCFHVTEKKQPMISGPFVLNLSGLCEAVAVSLARQINPILANLYQINTTQPPQNPPCWKCQIQLHLTPLASNERLDSRQARGGWRRAAATGGGESAAMTETRFGQKRCGRADGTAEVI